MVPISVELNFYSLFGYEHSLIIHHMKMRAGQKDVPIILRLLSLISMLHFRDFVDLSLCSSEKSPVLSQDENFPDRKSKSGPLYHCVIE